jgi:hypothetical protein
MILQYYDTLKQEQVDYRLWQVYVKVDLPEPAQDHLLRSKGIFGLERP